MCLAPGMPDKDKGFTTGVPLFVHPEHMWPQAISSFMERPENFGRAPVAATCDETGFSASRPAGPL